jgi:ubiquinone/menaquinone biosynthesis C-methylase UbiE
MGTPAASAQREWDAVAAAWDGSVAAVDRFKAPATARLVEWVAPATGERVLELGAGPGSLAVTWSELVGPSGSVVLSDIAPAMVEIAARRAAVLPNVEVTVLDAAAIDRPDGQFDVVVSRMGLMFAPDPASAFAEMRRVLAPGGRLGALTWAGMEHNPWMTCVGMAAAAHGMVAGPPIASGGIFSLGDPAQLEMLAKEAGFDAVGADAIDVVFESPGIDAHVAQVSSLAGPLAAAVDAATDDQRAALLRTAAEIAAPYAADGALRLPGRALLTTGRA